MWLKKIKVKKRVRKTADYVPAVRTELLLILMNSLVKTSQICCCHLCGRVYRICTLNQLKLQYISDGSKYEKWSFDISTTPIQHDISVCFKMCTQKLALIKQRNMISAPFVDMFSLCPSFVSLLSTAGWAETKFVRWVSTIAWGCSQNVDLIPLYIYHFFFDQPRTQLWFLHDVNITITSGGKAFL